MPIFPSFFVNKTGGYEIEQSLRFDGSAKLTKDSGFSDSSQTWTWSCWAKLCTTGEQVFLSAFNAYDSTSGGRYDFATYIGSNFAYIITSTGLGNGDVDQVASPGKYRDTSAWYHFLATSDGTDRILYINGEEVKRVARTANNQYLNQAHPHHIGGYDRVVTSNYYLAEAHFIDGTSYDPDNFGEYDANGVWRPIEVTGLTYGTNGFYLTFDPSATNGIGHDHSGNGNNFTPSGFTTSGTGTDVMSDTPTTNWATLNPLSPSQSQAALSNGNIDCTWSGVSGHSRRSTIAMGSGKWYAEITRGTSTLSVGLVDADIKLLSWPGNSTYGSTGSYAYRTDNGNKYNNGNASSYGNTIATGDVIGIAYDGDNGALYFSKNGTWQNSGDPTSGASATGAAFTGLGNQTWTIACGNAGGSTGGTATNFNFGQRDFEYTPPTGFKALNTSNLPAPDIADGSKYFNTVRYTGTGTTNARTDVGFQPDFVWIKERSGTDSGLAWHALFDAVRGNTKALYSNETNSESTGTAFSSFDSSGFTLGLDTTQARANDSGDAYVAWNWKANGSGSSNTDGSITSTVSANPTAGFSIVTWTGTGNDDSYGHGLGVKPAMIIHKRRNSTSDWHVWHQGLPTASPTNDVIYLNLTDAQNSGNNNLFRQDPTSTLIYTGTAGSHNVSGGTYVDYVFAEVEGYSKFGSYTGNGSTDGPFVATSFTPAFLIWKRTDTTANWFMVDAVRNTYNPVDKEFYPDQPNAENTFTDVDFLSNGFKLRASAADRNANGGTFIYMCFASNPFGGSGVSPATAR